MGWIIFWAIFALFAVILLIPLRITFAADNRPAPNSTEDAGVKWHVTIKYGLIQVFEIGSDVEKKQKKPKKPKKKKKPAKSDEEPHAAPPKPDPSPAAETETPEPLPDTHSPSDEEIAEMTDEELFGAAQKPDEKTEKKGFFKKILPSNLSEGVDFVGDILSSLSPPLRLLAKHLHFVNLRVTVDVASEDAAKTAITYGAVSGGAFFLLGQLQSVFDIRAEQFGIRADFFGDKLRFSASGELNTTPFSLLCVALGIGGRFLWKSFWRVRRQDKEKAATTKKSSKSAKAEQSAAG